MKEMKSFTDDQHRKTFTTIVLWKMVKEVDRIQIITWTCTQRMVIILATNADEKGKTHS